MNFAQFPRCDQTAPWRALGQRVTQAGEALDLQALFAADPQRAQRFSFSAPHVWADLSKQRWDADVLAQLLELAQLRGLVAHRDALFAGEPINTTEGRAVMHWLLRQPDDAPEAPNDAKTAKKQQNQPYVQYPLCFDATKSVANAFADLVPVRQAMLALAEQIRADVRITDVVNIGIGGSDLGPQMVTLALGQLQHSGKRIHFVSNVDGHQLASVLAQCQPRSTLFLIASKTFTTIETMTNAASAKRWFEAGGGTDTARHFCALTTNVAAANAFGITTTFGFWDWVGGRYSLWSAIGLPIAIAIGAARFDEFLSGAAEMDAHFAHAPLAQNLPVIMGLLDVLNRNFHGYASRSVAPYHQALQRLPAFLQQLEMESNGKRVGFDGAALPFATSPVVWGEPGTNGQHAYFQMLHQGSEAVPLEFVAVREAAHDLSGHHNQLLANAIAQAQAFMVGKADVGGHKHFPGNRPSSFLVLEALTPRSLGALLALYEHRVFVAGSIWGINSFDQFGVELGKVLAKDVALRLDSGDTAGLDSSTAALIARLR